MTDETYDFNVADIAERFDHLDSNLLKYYSYERCNWCGKAIGCGLQIDEHHFGTEYHFCNTHCIARWDEEEHKRLRHPAYAGGE